jgi:hypothetical protein
MSGSLLQNFLKARQLIDTNAPDPATPKKDKPNTMEKPSMDDAMSVRTIIDTKPSKKVVMDFLKEKVKQYTDISSSEED